MFDEDEIEEQLERIGYSGDRLEAMKVFLRKWCDRKAVLGDKTMTVTDIVTASFIFNSFNRKKEK